MVRHQRTGKIAGLLVLFFLILLIPIWALGHWLSRSYPVRDSDMTLTAVKSRNSIGPSVDGSENPETSLADADEPRPSAMTNVASENESTNFDPGRAYEADVDSAKIPGNQFAGQASSPPHDRLIEQQTQLQNDLDDTKQQLIAAIDARKQAEQSAKQALADRTVLQQKLRDQQARFDAAANASVAQPMTQSPTDGPTDRRRRWTATSGMTVMATFLEIKDDNVKLYAKGKVHSVPLSKLEPADRKIALQLNLE